MTSSNKTRYAILGILLDGPSSGYEIKCLIKRSTAYFWSESDSTIYPTLKKLAEEEKVCSEVVYVGKKKKEIYSITTTGKEEFQNWLQTPTRSETIRNEFLLKFFFATDSKEALRLQQERLRSSEKLYEEYKEIEKRLESFQESFQKRIRLKALRYGIDQLILEIQWLKEQC